jgi:hypothetical protein
MRPRSSRTCSKRRRCLSGGGSRWFAEIRGDWGARPTGARVRRKGPEARSHPRWLSMISTPAITSCTWLRCRVRLRIRLRTLPPPAPAPPSFDGQLRPVFGIGAEAISEGGRRRSGRERLSGGHPMLREHSSTCLRAAARAGSRHSARRSAACRARARTCRRAPRHRPRDRGRHGWRPGTRSRATSRRPRTSRWR